MSTDEDAKILAKLNAMTKPEGWTPHPLLLIIAVAVVVVILMLVIFGDEDGNIIPGITSRMFIPN